MWSNKEGAEAAKGMLPGRQAAGPLLLVVVTTLAVFLITFMQFELEGSVMKLGEKIWQDGLTKVLQESWILMCPDLKTVKVTAALAGFELALMKLPGTKFTGPVTPMGNTPRYVDNGFTAFILTLVCYIAGVECGLYNGGILAEVAPQMFALLNGFALIFCIFLTIKGLKFPSSSDSGSNGNLVMDFYWGTELYPRILGFDVKTFTNCRFGLIVWAMLPISYCYRSVEQSDDGALSPALAISTGLQLVYLAKFYWWEAGYMRSIDIMQDRAGYYICWGCLVWVPVFYTSATQFIFVHHKTIDQNLSPEYCWAIAILGWLSIFINYDSDNQRAVFRSANGECLIFGKPATYITASYTAGDGKPRKSLLLTSGYWGLSRHFHYIPEITASFFWSAPALFTHFWPYCYVFPFLTLLLFDRAFRDDARCSDKYGKDWDDYRSLVKYKVIPGVI